MTARLTKRARGGRVVPIVPRPAPVGWVLAGGGARGAYEVGVCSYIFDRVARDLGTPIPIDIISGTSVGAIHACALASGVDDPRAAAARLIERWSGLRMNDIVHVDRRRTFAMIRALFGHPRHRSSDDVASTGILDPQPLRALLSASVDFARIAEHVRRGRLRTVSVSATHVASGRTTVFFQRGGPDLQPWARRRTWAYPVALSAEHAMASAAIPFLFPAVTVRGALYCDGSVRQNVPLSPARHLGARALVVITPRSASSYRVATAGGAEREDAFPEPVFLAGKLLNALSLDRADDDIAQIGLVNRWLDAGTRRFGPTFAAELNRELGSGGSPPLVPIPLLHLDSSEDIGQIAAAYVRSPSFQARRLAFVERAIARLAERQAANEADLASYLLFDGGFARALIDLGWNDAKARHDRIVSFFRSAVAATGTGAAA
jgi:NTE family protein